MSTIICLLASGVALLSSYLPTMYQVARHSRDHASSLLCGCYAVPEIIQNVARHSRDHASSLGKPTTAQLTFSPLDGQLVGEGPILLHPLPHPQMDLARLRRTARGER